MNINARSENKESAEDDLIGFGAVLRATEQTSSFLFGEERPFYSMDYNVSMDVVGADVLPRNPNVWYGQVYYMWDRLESLCEYISSSENHLPVDSIVLLQFSMPRTRRNQDQIAAFIGREDNFVYLPYLCDNSNKCQDAKLIGYEVIGQHQLSAVHNLWFYEEQAFLRERYSHRLNNDGLFASLQDADEYAETLTVCAPEIVPFLVIAIREVKGGTCWGEL